MAIEPSSGKHSETPADDSQARTGASLNRLKLGLLFAILATCLVIAAQPTYRWWHASQSRFYDDACERLAVAESWEQMEATARQWVEWDPQASRGWIHLGDALLKQNRVQEGADALGKIQDSYPGALETLMIRGDILFSDLNQPYAAMENWERMLRINDRATIARQRMIYFYAMTMQRDRMREEIFRAIELGSEEPEVYTYLYLAYDINFSDGLRMARKWLQTYPEDETLQVAAAVYLAAFEYEDTISIMESNPFAGGDFSEANRLRSIYPDNLELQAFFLEEAVFQGDFAEVASILENAPPGAEEDPRFWRARGWYFLEQGELERAEEALRKGLEMNPYDWRARTLLSSVFRQSNRPEEAAEETRLSLIGKELYQELYELSNSRLIGNDLAQRIYDFSLEIGADTVAQGMARRLGQFGP